jgi:NAD(P)-dependent dehydrogenase (short-subunit alcohol dehydrogenase family)
VSRVLITGSTDGLGRAAAGALMDDGHDVVLHARTRERAASVTGLAAHAAGVVIGDLSSAAEIRALALTLARAWPEVASNAVDPGWVPTRMDGAGAPDNLEMGHLTQTWLAVRNDAAAIVSGGYWYHRQRQMRAPQARDPAFQDELMDRLAALTGVALF